MNKAVQPGTKISGIKSLVIVYPVINKIAVKNIKKPNQVASLKGKDENDAIPSQANRHIFASGYLVSPATLGCLS